MTRGITIIAALLVATTPSWAGTLLDEIRPHIDQRIELGTGDNVLEATVLTVDEDHFCVRVHVPDFEHRRCYAAAVVSFVSDAAGTRPFGVWVFEPRGRPR